MKPKYRVFFDSSVVFCAILSKTGGSAKVLGYLRSGQVQGFTTQTVLEETGRNLKKYSRRRIDFGEQIAKSALVVFEKISSQDINPYVGLIHEKDAHIICGAKLTRCDFILTLDKKHIQNETVKRNFPEFNILSPKELIKLIEK
jgi:predicted nucleic acid-binding protein